MILSDCWLAVFLCPNGLLTPVLVWTSGKTTICSLIARFYDADRGSVSVGGHDVKEFTCDSLLSNISMVFQNVYLFHDTVRNNICFGKPDATEEEMIAAAKKACCHDFIMALPQGYDTVIGEGGGSHPKKIRRMEYHRLTRIKNLIYIRQFFVLL